jgi:hypothetical protein
MGGAWRYRVAKDDKGKLHFVFARYDTSDPNHRCGLTGILNEGDDIEGMRRLAQQLQAACDDPIIPLEEYGDEDADEDTEGDWS